ncbi:hypothetical protein ACFO5O_11905 [Geojedonia litorea]|uniref:Uncharacterized protein n=1 Tax=Geojedonia litorea TaxID=1268269 RepID=A0ABV9N6B2_9FLAO
MSKFNKRIGNIFVAISNNKVVYASSNFADLIKELKKIDRGIMSRNHYRSIIIEKGIYEFTSDVTSINYTLQRIENDKV